jgi:hypothetical protein
MGRLKEPDPRQCVGQRGASFRDLVEVVLKQPLLVRIARRQGEPCHVHQHVVRSLV